MTPIANHNHPSTASCEEMIDGALTSSSVSLSLSRQYDLVRTYIRLPATTAEDNNSNYLYLPKSVISSPVAPPHCVPIDEYLSTIGIISSKAKAILSRPPVVINNMSTSDGRNNILKVLNVCQREVAHAIPSQCDVMISDNATTCHFLGFRSCSSSLSSSSSGENWNKPPLTSLTHIDAAGYDDCIRRIIQRHIRYHNYHRGQRHSDPLSMDVYLLGGFSDGENTSRALSHHLLHLLSVIANEESSRVEMTLQICAVSCMNSYNNRPVGRGLGIHMSSGTAFLATVDDESDAGGPALLIRDTRLWSSERTAETTLAVIHDEEREEIRIEPFLLGLFPEGEWLLGLEDGDLLDCCSTSPEAERDDFCVKVRRTLSFLISGKGRLVFGRKGNRRPIVYRRLHGNEWTLLLDLEKEGNREAKKRADFCRSS